MTPIRIRPATLADAPVIVDFNHAMALETENLQLDLPTLRRGVDRILQNPALGRYFVADGGTVVGQIMFTFEWSDWRDGHLWWIQSVYVHPDHRRRGIYRMLHTHVRTEAQRCGNVVGLRLYAHDTNHRAATTYQHLGMHRTDYRVFAENFAAHSAD